MNTTIASTVAIGERPCDSEPIRIPGSIQPHGVLLTLDAESFKVLQVSDNLHQYFGMKADQLVGRTLQAIFGEDDGVNLVAILKQVKLSNHPFDLTSVKSGGRDFHVIAHQYDGVVVLEFEAKSQGAGAEFGDLYPIINTFVSRLSGLNRSLNVAEVAAAQVRELTQFDRVLVYKFDENWNGTVIAESRNRNLPSYLDLRFPAGDIPAQARDLYRLNPFRIIIDATYSPAALRPENNPKTEKPLDMSFCVLRSVSPVHREYMRNMGTAASMSISILQKDRLWGLISCHNREPRSVDFNVRQACEFIGRVISVQIEAQDSNAIFAEQVRLKSIESHLLAHMAHYQSFSEGLIASDMLLEFAAAEGAAVLHEGHCGLVGRTPKEQEVQAIVEWLSDSAPKEEVFQTDRLGDLFPESAKFSTSVCGLLAIRISKLHKSYVLWFRPEVVQLVRWAGDPTKSAQHAASLHPRHSFELWKETVRGRSLPFSSAQVDAAVQLRGAIVGIVLRKAEEMAELSAQLTRSNKELEAFSYSVSHDLRAPFRHIAGYSELLREREGTNLTPDGQRYLTNILDAARFAGDLVDHLLDFSRFAKVPLSTMRLGLDKLVSEVRSALASEIKDRKVEWKVGPLPEVIADPVLLRLALFNLLSNSLKYTKKNDLAVIEISAANGKNEVVVCIRDNGIGFDMKYVDKLFGVFQRLHRMEDFEGTGIGLAIVRRIIERHGGRSWAEGEIGKGASFYFALPAEEDNEGD